MPHYRRIVCWRSKPHGGCHPYPQLSGIRRPVVELPHNHRAAGDHNRHGAQRQSLMVRITTRAISVPGSWRGSSSSKLSDEPGYRQPYFASNNAASAALADIRYAREVQFLAVIIA
jgi:hypothetical protein